MVEFLSTLKRVPWLLSRFIANERKFYPQYDVPPRTRLTLYRNGFFSYAGVLYDVDRLDEYLSDVEQHRTQRINGEMGSALRNKVVASELLSEGFRAHVPETIAILSNGSPFSMAGEAMDLDELVDRLPVVCKPIAGGRGRGVSILEGDPAPRINGRETTEDLIREWLAKRDEYVVVDCVDQHEYAERIFPDAWNSIRIVTMVDPETREPFVAMAVHRFGTPESAPLDNLSTGGVNARVDVETGELGPVSSPLRGSEITWHESHPTTGERVAGVDVPEWEGVREMVLGIADRFSHLWQYVGWDVILSADGIPMVIEGNRASDVDIMQIHEPLLADPRRRRFYEHHGVV